MNEIQDQSEILPLLIKDDFLNQALEAKPGSRKLLEDLAIYHRPSVEHSIRTAQIIHHLGQFLAQDLGLTDKDQITLDREALLHDIGKIDVSLEVLNSLPFSHLEDDIRTHYFQEIQKHPTFSAKRLREIGDERIATIVESHHQFQENKYPDNLNLEEDFVFKQLLALADQIDSMMSQKFPGDESKSANQVVSELQQAGFFPLDWIKKAVTIRNKLS